MTTTTDWILGRRFDEALAYVANLHRGQKRKGTDRGPDGARVNAIPYVSHLLAVASLVIECRGLEDEAIAALLHDALEDQPRGGATEVEIRERFGERVLEIIKGCTKEEVDKKLPLEEQRQQRRESRARYFEHLHHVDGSVLLVSAADKLHNVRAIVADLREHGPSALDRFNDDRTGTLWYYRELARALSRAGAPVRLVIELERGVREMHELAEVELPT